MAKFSGIADEFKRAIEALNLPGTWEDFSHGLRYRTSEGGTIQWFLSTKTIQVQGNPSVKGKLSALMENLENHRSMPIIASTIKSEQESRISAKKIFLVHGHDRTSLDQLELIILKLGLDPFVLANTSGKGLTILEALEAEIGRDGNSACGIVLLTPDDMGYAIGDGAEKIQARARQNVVLEMGMLMVAVGRSNTIVLKKGNLESPSDTSGLLHIPFQNHVKEAAPRLVSRLQDAGFEIDTKRIINATS